MENQEINNEPKEAEVNQEQSAVEEKARTQGWVPKEEFRGDPSKWRDAKAFVEHGESINGILKERNDHLNREISEMRQSVKELADFYKQTEQRAYERALKEVDQKRVEAVANADVDAFNAAEKERMEMERARFDQMRTTKPEEPPEMATFRQNNAWYESDPELTAEADALGVAYAKQGTSYGKILEKVTERIKVLHPEKFANSRRENASSVDFSSDTGLPKKEKAKSYANLPADAKAQCDKFVRTIPGFTKERYVADYAWD